MAINIFNNINRDNEVTLKSLQIYIDRFIDRNRKTMTAELKINAAAPAENTGLPASKIQQTSGRTQANNPAAEQVTESNRRGIVINTRV